MHCELGRLTSCGLRDVWEDENEFSDWLMGQDNMEMLTDVCGINDLEELVREDRIGDFRADISGKEVSTGNKVIIENQFGYSNHDHLGKIITYAAGRDANIIIWITEHARTEHRSAVEWLNMNTESDIGFFLLEVSVCRIGKSQAAPLFSLIEGPNEWNKVNSSTAPRSEALHLEFWQRFLDHLSERPELMKQLPNLSSRRSNKSPTLIADRGNGHYRVEANVFSKNLNIHSIGVNIWIPDDKDLYRRFESNKDSIEKEIGYRLDWDYKPDKIASSVRLKIDAFEDHTDSFDWLIKNLIRFKEVFGRLS